MNGKKVCSSLRRVGGLIKFAISDKKDGKSKVFL